MRKIIVFLTLLLLTGCKAEYSLSYVDDKIYESIDIISDNNEIINGESFSSLINNFSNENYVLVDYRYEPGDMSEDEILSIYNTYNEQILNHNNKYGLKLEYIHNKAEYKYSTVANSLFKSVSVNEFYIKATDIIDIFKTYPFLEIVSIKFNTDKNIMSSNCDEIKDGELYWYLNEENYKDKNVEIYFDNNFDGNIKVGKIKVNLPIIFYILLIILLVGVIIIYDKIKNSNN